MKTIAVINQKGGVGKTACAYNLAYAFSKHLRTLLIDLDPSGNASKGLISHIEKLDINTIKNVLLDKSFDPFFAVFPSIIQGVEIENLFVIPAKIDLALAQRELVNKVHREMILARQIKRLGKRQDIIILDCSPTLSDLTINAIYAADYFIIPVTYEEDALDGISDLFKIINEIKENHVYSFKILRNKKNASKTKTNEYIEDKLKDFVEKGNVFNTIIRQDENINQAKIERKTIFQYAPNSNGAQDFLTLTKEILNEQK